MLSTRGAKRVESQLVSRAARMTRVSFVEVITQQLREHYGVASIRYPQVHWMWGGGLTA